jgi:uncharacterized protein YukE
MANVDLYGNDAQRIRNQYKTSLQRDASDDDVTGWLSGQFGGGGVDQWLQQIDTSHEAQQYKQPRQVGQQRPEVSGTLDPGGAAPSNPATPQSPYQNLDWWSGQGVPQTQIFDNTTGQLLPGWSRTGLGYERSTPQTPQTPGPQNGDYQSWFMSLVNGKPPTSQQLEALAPMLQQHGIRLGGRSAAGTIDGIFLPDGTFVDVVEAMTPQGGKRWQWGVQTGGVGGGALPGNQYSDPYSKMLEELIKSRIGNLQGGYDDSSRQAYQQALQQRAQSLATGNKQLDQLMAYLQERFTDLKGPGYTGAENEVLRTQALDPIERDRSAARQRLTERLAAMGHTPQSGVFQDAMRRLDAEFEGIRGVSQTQLATNEIGRRENRNQRAEMIGAQLADIPELRAREQLDVFQALESLGMVARNEDEARSREAITYGGVLSDLGPQRLQLAMQAAGMGGNPASLGGVLSNIAGMNQQGAAYNAQQQSQLWSGLGSLAAIIARSGQSGLSGIRG